MSTPLPLRAEALRDRLVKLDKLAANLGETVSLEDLRSELAPPVAELSRSLNQGKLLFDAGIDVVEPASVAAVRRSAAILLTKFVAQKKAATLKKGTGWANLVRDIKAASTDTSNNAIKSWKSYGQTVFTGEAPSIVKGRIAFTSTNSSAFSEYERLYQLLRGEFDKLPLDQMAIAQVRVLADKLKTTAKAFDFSVPDDVKRFLVAIQNGGASLDLLTVEVQEWLRAKNEFYSYRILPAGR